MSSTSIKIDVSGSKIIVTPSIFNPVYIPMLFKDNRFMVLYGGAGSGKSYFAAQKFLLRMLGEKDSTFLLIRKVHKSIRNSQFKLLKEIAAKWNVEKYFRFNKTDMSVLCSTGSSIITAGTDDVEKLKSIHGINGIWIEEATELEESDFNQINLRLRGKTKYYKQIILTFNPIDDEHWLPKRFPKLKTP